MGMPRHEPRRWLCHLTQRRFRRCPIGPMGRQECLSRVAGALRDALPDLRCQPIYARAGGMCHVCRLFRHIIGSRYNRRRLRRFYNRCRPTHGTLNNSATGSRLSSTFYAAYLCCIGFSMQQGAAGCVAWLADMCRCLLKLGPRENSPGLSVEPTLELARHRLITWVFLWPDTHCLGAPLIEQPGACHFARGRGWRFRLRRRHSRRGGLGFGFCCCAGSSRGVLGLCWRVLCLMHHFYRLVNVFIERRL